jgi:tripartite-type tricarboxylate transporter receptor subunit TctC
MTILKHIALAGLGLLIGTSGALAQSAADFFKGRQLTMLVYSGAGSTYDIYARLLAKHMPNHLPGKPTIITQYMVGAGGLKQVDYMNKIAPRDGTVFGTIGRGLAFEPMLGKNEVGFDPLKFNWLGSMNREITVALSWNTAKIKTFEDLKTMELLVPGTGAGADSEIVPRAYNSLAGTKFKIISGYRDTSEAALQMETGELTGLAYWSWSSIIAAHPDWIRDKKVNLLFQTGVKEIPGVPGVPRIRELVSNPTDRKALEFLLAREVIGRPFLLPPGVPADRVKFLREAFAETMKDPAFIKDAETGNVEVNLVTGEEVDALLKDAATSPSEVIERVKKILDR